MKIIENKKLLNKIDDYTKKRKEYIAIDEDDDFIKYEIVFVEKIHQCGSGMHFENTKTHKNCGKTIKILTKFYDSEGNFVPDGITDDDCYKVVLGD